MEKKYILHNDTIEAYPWVGASWDCPNCDAHLATLPKAVMGFIKCPMCGLRYDKNDFDMTQPVRVKRILAETDTKIMGGF